MRSLKSLTRQTHFWRICCLLGADILLFGTTDPNNIASFMLIVGFLMLSATIYYLLKGLLALGRLYGLEIKRKQRFLRVGTAIISGTLALQSIGQLSGRDILVLSPLTLLLYMYLSYARSVRQNPASS